MHNPPEGLTWEQLFEGVPIRYNDCGDDPGNLPRVVAAAVRTADRKTVYAMPPPARHHDLIWHLGRLDGVEMDHDEFGQGFMLSNGGYANRPLAKICAEANGQLLPLKPGRYNGPKLFSEDVW